MSRPSSHAALLCATIGALVLSSAVPAAAGPPPSEMWSTHVQTIAEDDPLLAEDPDHGALLLPVATHVPGPARAAASARFSPVVARTTGAAGHDSLPSRADVWAWPVFPVPTVARGFDGPPKPWMPGHRGVDLDVPVGTEVHSPVDGRVVAAGTVVDRMLVSVESSSGTRATFEPVEPLVTVGQIVTRGEVIGRVLDGHEPGALHWGARIDDDHYLDPLRLLVPGVGLLPWEGAGG